MAGPLGNPNYRAGRNAVYGDLVVTGSLYVSGSHIYLSGSQDIYLSSSKITIGTDPNGLTQFTGSIYVSGSTRLSGDLIVTGSVYTSGSVVNISGSQRIYLSSSYIQIGSDPFGSNTITGSLYVTGSRIFLTASDAIAISSSHVHIGTFDTSVTITGSVSMTGNLSTQGFDTVRLGSTLTGMTSSYGVGTINHVGSAFAIYGSRTNGANNDSVRVIANTNNTSIDDNHVICKFGWMSSGPEFTGSWNIKSNTIEAEDLTAAEILGTELDGGSAIGTVLGSSASYVTDGAKLLSVQNAGQEREATYYDGTRYFLQTNYGAYVKDTYFSSLISTTASNLMFTDKQVPAGSTIMGVASRVVVSCQTASVLAVGISSSLNGFVEYWGDYMGSNAGVTNFTASMKAGNIYCATDTPIYVSSSVLQGNATTTGSVRVECFYRTIQVPTA